MIEWISINWKELLGTGGVGVILVALINLRQKSKSGSRISQKTKSGKNTTTYQAGGSINIGSAPAKKEEVDDERKPKN